MTQRTSNKRHIRNIQKSGGTYYITIPINVMRELGWRERQKVEVKKKGQETIIITDWKK